MFFTEHHLCFFSNGVFGNKVVKQTSFIDIKTAEKQKSLLGASAIKLSLKDGKKLVLSWKQSNTCDAAFLLLQQHRGIKQLEVENDVVNSDDTNSLGAVDTVRGTGVSKPSEAGAELQATTHNHTQNQQPTLSNWSRFDD